MACHGCYKEYWILGLPGETVDFRRQGYKEGSGKHENPKSGTHNPPLAKTYLRPGRKH